jgi:polyvinyl alcohol dehydrogenase (cytochrome)
MMRMHNTRQRGRGGAGSAGSLRRGVIVALGLVAFLVAAPAASGAAKPTSGGSTPAEQLHPSSWPVGGGDAAGDRYQAHGPIRSGNVGRLVPRWVFTTHGDTSATPTVAGGVVYFPDFGGYLNAVDARTGALRWQRRVSSYDGVPGAISRTSPAVAGDLLVIGDNIGTYHTSGAHVSGIDRRTGDPVWSTQVDPHPAAVITGSPVVYGNSAYVGISSSEEGLSVTEPGYPCCTFRGSVISLDLATGAVNWQYHDIPAPLDHACAAANPPTGCGYSGAAIWSTPAIDPVHHAVVVGTGNNYTVPDGAEACEGRARATSTPDGLCTDPADRFESVIALDLTTGEPHWAHKVAGFDAWTALCIFAPAGVTWCPSPFGPDYDFGSGPNIYQTTVDGQLTAVVGIGQKSGIYWAMRGDTGATLWSTLVGPGSLFGGIQWGTATDGIRVYAPIANVNHEPYTLTPSGRTTSAGSWSALDARTGQLLWQTADPNPSVPFDVGPPTVTNDVVFAGSLSPTGDNMVALDARTGAILWRFACGGSVAGGPAVVGDTVYWGSGYARTSFIGTNGSNRFYAFTLPKDDPD